MAINYTKVGWDTTKYVNPTNMNKMDNGIKAAADGVDALNDALSFHAGDTLTITNLYCAAGAFLASDDIRFTVPLPKSARGLTASITGGSLYIRGPQGSVVSAGAIANYIITVVQNGDFFITFSIKKTDSSAFNVAGSTALQVNFTGSAAKIAFS